MAFDQSFLIALLLLVVGCGFLKGNVASQVGALYAADDELNRVRGYAIFSMGINIGATLGPILCGYLAYRYGWHVGFGTAALFIFLGLLTYLAGYKQLPARVERKQSEARKLTDAEWRRVLVICAVLVITIFQSIAYFQCFNTAAVWIQQHVSLQIGTFGIPVPWFNSVDAVSSVVGVPLVFALWRWQAKHGGEPDDLSKISAGAWLSAGANLILVLAIALTGGEHVSPIWPLLYYATLGIAFLFYWPTTLALVSRSAPAPVNATMMGLAYITYFFTSIAIGRLGGFYEPLGPSMFWLMHAAIGAGGGIAVLLFGRTLTKALESR